MAKKMFKNLSLTQKTILYLKKQLGTNLEEIGYKSGKYRVFLDKYNEDNKYYLVGKAGAVRLNSKPSVSGSISITHKSKIVVKGWAEKQEQTELVELP